MLFWSDKAYAKQCVAEEWSHYVPAVISLADFTAHWLHGMHEDELLVGVNWNKDLVGLEMEPLDLLAALQEKMDGDVLAHP